MKMKQNKVFDWGKSLSLKHILQLYTCVDISIVYNGQSLTTSTRVSIQTGRGTLSSVYL